MWFISDTTAIHIFVKGLWNAHNIMAKIYVKDPQTLSKVIKLVEKLNTAQQLTAILIPPTINMMSNDNKCFVWGKTGHIGHHCPSAQCDNCDGFDHFAQDCPEKISPSGTPCCHDRSHPNHVMTTTAGTDHSLFITDEPRKVLPLVSITLPNPLWQKLQQLSEACIPLPIPPLQQPVIPIHQRTL